MINMYKTCFSNIMSYNYYASKFLEMVYIINIKLCVCVCVNVWLAILFHDEIQILICV